MKLTIACNSNHYEDVVRILDGTGYIMGSSPVMMESSVFFYLNGVERTYEVSIAKRRHGGLIDTKETEWEAKLLKQLNEREYKKFRIVSHVSPNLYARLENYMNREGGLSQSAAIAKLLNGALPQI